MTHFLANCDGITLTINSRTSSQQILHTKLDSTELRNDQQLLHKEKTERPLRFADNPASIQRNPEWGGAISLN
jgi:hypothetical protein